MLVRATFLFASVITLLPAIALAQDAAATAPAMGASATPIAQICQSELSSLCKDAGDRRGAQFRCLEDNKDKLTADCAAAVKDMHERRTAMRAACKDDAVKNCPDLKGGELMACLRGKLSDLSKSCSDALASMPQPVKQ